MVEQKEIIQGSDSAALRERARSLGQSLSAEHYAKLQVIDGQLGELVHDMEKDKGKPFTWKERWRAIDEKVKQNRDVAIRWNPNPERRFRG